MFVDNVELSLLSGAGGSGSISFKSKGTKSSPNGGSGGDGGSIYFKTCLLYTSPSPRDRTRSRMPSSA